MRENTDKGQYLFIFILLLFCYYMYGISRIYGFELIPDEFGYWTYAAALSGCDWSDIVSTGSYYSFGYTLILYPIFQIFQDSVAAYRAAVTVNFLLMVLACCILIKLLSRLQGEKRQKAALIAAIAVLYPSWLYYARCTMTEILIMSMYVVICMLMELYLEKNQKRILTVLILSLVYIYTVHMRTIGILIAAAMTLGAHLVRQNIGKNRRPSVKVLFLLLGGVLLFWLANQIKDYSIGHLYTEQASEAISYNDYSGQIEKVQGIFTIQGFCNLMISAVCKIWYLGLASFGLFYWGIGLCVGRLINEKKFIYLFILLATAGEIAVTSIYTTGMGGRIDGLTYGRYNEQILPILMGLGCIAIAESKMVVRRLLLTAGLQLPILGLIIFIIQKYNQTNIHAYMVLGISYLFDEKSFEPAAYHIAAYAAAMVLMVIVTVLVRLASTKQIPRLLIAVMTLELILGMRLTSIFSDETQLANFRDVQLIDIVHEEKAEHDRLVYLQEEDRNYVDYLQFHLRDAQIQLVYHSNEISADDLIVTDYLYSGLEELKTEYANWRIMGHLAVFYN